jgi:hypothetical protein
MRFTVEYVFRREYVVCEDQNRATKDGFCLGSARHPLGQPEGVDCSTPFARKHGRLRGAPLHGACRASPCTGAGRRSAPCNDMHVLYGHTGWAWVNRECWRTSMIRHASCHSLLRYKGFSRGADPLKRVGRSHCRFLKTAVREQLEPNSGRFQKWRGWTESGDTQTLQALRGIVTTNRTCRFLT